MPKRAKAVGLPPDVRAWLESALRVNGFSHYAQLAAELRKKGFSISSSAVHRFGAALEKKVDAISAGTEAAVQIARAVPDDEDQRSAAVLAMIQMKLFEALVSMKDAAESDKTMDRAKLMSVIAENVAVLSRATVSQKRHSRAVRVKARAAADKVERMAKRQGLSPDLVEEIRREILGIAGP